MKNLMLSLTTVASFFISLPLHAASSPMIPPSSIQCQTSYETSSCDVAQDFYTVSSVGTFGNYTFSNGSVIIGSDGKAYISYGYSSAGGQKLILRVNEPLSVAIYLPHAAVSGVTTDWYSTQDGYTCASQRSTPNAFQCMWALYSTNS